MSTHLRRVGLAFFCALLGSCLGGGGADDGGGGGGPSSCTSITGGTSQVTTAIGTGCFGCSVADAQAAVDGDLTTSATVTAPESFTGDGARIRATAQSGLVFPDGQTVAVFFESPAFGGLNPPDTAVTIKTFLSGEQQDSPTTYTTVLQDPSNGRPYSFKGFVATKAFDSVEVMVSDTQGASGPWQIHEICSDATAPE
jgi:hypothetical protein